MRLSHRHALLVPFLALGFAACQEDPPPPDTHGFVKIGLLRGTAETDSPYTGTSKIRVTMSYDQCFTSFYEAFPNWTIDGVDGSPVFGTVEDGGEGWKDRLCDPPSTSQAECTVESFDQELANASQLTIVYVVGSDLENRLLRFGPLPLIAEIPEFECDVAPRMSILAQQVTGNDANGNKIWSGQSIDGDGEATPGQGTEIGIRAARED